MVTPLTNLLKGLSKHEKEGRLLLRGRLSPAAEEALKQEFAAQWTEEAALAFNRVKHALTSSPVLILPDYEQHFEVVCDACQTPPAVGAVLMQNGRPVAYYSRKLSGAELNYSVSDIEMLAVISALKEWRCYLENPKSLKPFTLVTDHQPNVYLDTATNAHTVHRRARWLSVSCGYKYNWCYRPGRENVADPISRAPQHFHHLCASVVVAHRVGALTAARDTLQLAWTEQNPGGPSDLVQHRAAQLCCHLCATTRVLRSRSRATIPDAASHAGPRTEDRSRSFAGGGDVPRTPSATREATSNNLNPSPTGMGVADSDVHHEEQQEISDFFLDNFFDRVRQGYTHDSTSESRAFFVRLRVDAQGLRWTPHEQLYIPDWDNLRFECFEAVHKHPFSGHFGGHRTQTKASQLFYWPNMARSIQAWVNECDSCQRVKAVRQAPAGELHPLEIPGRRWASISMDLITDLPSTPLGHDSIWVCVDRLTKMVHHKAVTKTVTAPELARIFTDEVFRLHGLPEDIVSDRDPRFTASFWSQLHRLLQVRLNMSTRDHPQSDGQCHIIPFPMSCLPSSSLLVLAGDWMGTR
jgi:hypothetical protein